MKKILEEKLKVIKIIKKGRKESYIRKSPSYNPYKKSVLYDWQFKMKIDDLVFEAQLVAQQVSAGRLC